MSTSSSLASICLSLTYRCLSIFLSSKKAAFLAYPLSLLWGFWRIALSLFLLSWSICYLIFFSISFLSLTIFIYLYSALFSGILISSLSICMSLLATTSTFFFFFATLISFCFYPFSIAIISWLLSITYVCFIPTSEVSLVSFWEGPLFHPESTSFVILSTIMKAFLSFLYSLIPCF